MIPRRRRRRAASGLAGLLLGAMALLSAAAAQPASPAAASFAPVAITAKPIERFEFGSAGTRFGELEFRGGLELISRNRDFGGLSGLAFDEASGTLVAVADTGWWFLAKPVLTNGRLTGLSDTRMARMLDPKGRPIRRKSQGDAESVRLLNRGGPAVLVMYEEINRLRLFRGPLDKLASVVPTELPMPAGINHSYGATGIEAVAVSPQAGPLKGAVVLIAERNLDEAGNHKGWIVDGPLAGAFSVKRTDSYDVTDAEFLPGGDLLILERRFGFSQGVGMRIRRIAAADIRPGATADGTVLIDAGLRQQIDNMEGLAVRPGANGETMIFIVSDDNKSMLQRTLLLQFAWKPGASAPAPLVR